MSRTILLAGGGTGGHVYPLVAVADALRRAEPSLRIVFIGTKRGIETRVVPACGYELELVQVEPIRGMGALGALWGLWSACTSLPASRTLLRRLHPVAVLTVGGYAAGPISLAARAMSIPLALLEPNAVMGLANRAIAPLVSRAYTAFPDVERHFAAHKVLRCGVPIRAGFRPAPLQERPEQVCVLVLGGSQGARTLNDNVPIALGSHRSKLVIRHQCGQADVGRVKQQY
ncbi:MAG: UDP-N-acetylglucosamine--N-acetylmuramyl-(pentapeptide) pyrophosphoryl-undecaprenol N-acetylglucosamine transferase, partial [Myxococcales bacterium]